MLKRGAVAAGMSPQIPEACNRHGCHYSRRLPIICEPNYADMLIKVLQQFANSFLLTWQNQIGTDIGQRLKHKLS